MEYCLSFAWNFRSDIIARVTDFTDAGGMFIVPFPELTLQSAPP